MLGKLHCVVANLHLGALKEFGYSSAMMDGRGQLAPASIEVHSQDLLNHEQIKSAIGAGVIYFEPAKKAKGKKAKEAEELVEGDQNENSQPLESSSEPTTEPVVEPEPEAEVQPTSEEEAQPEEPVTEEEEVDETPTQDELELGDIFNVTSETSEEPASEEEPKKQRGRKPKNS